MKRRDFLKLAAISPIGLMALAAAKVEPKEPPWKLYCDKRLYQKLAHLDLGPCGDNSVRLCRKFLEQENPILKDLPTIA